MSLFRSSSQKRPENYRRAERDFPDNIFPEIVMFLPTEENYPAAAYSKMSDAPEQSFASKKERSDAESPLVLIFSKEEDTRFLFRTLLEMWNYRTEECGDFKHLSPKIQKCRPALVLLDSVFPFDENLNAVRNLRGGENCADAPIIMISGFAQPNFRLDALNVGTTEYLVKPIDFDALETSLKKNIDGFSASAKIS